MYTSTSTLSSHEVSLSSHNGFGSEAVEHLFNIICVSNLFSFEVEDALCNHIKVGLGVKLFVFTQRDFSVIATSGSKSISTVGSSD
jgi:hypothetical protein